MIFAVPVWIDTPADPEPIACPRRMLWKGGPALEKLQVTWCLETVRGIVKGRIADVQHVNVTYIDPDSGEVESLGYYYAEDLGALGGLITGLQWNQPDDLSADSLYSYLQDAAMDCPEVL